MSRITTTLRRADPARLHDLPGCDARAEEELEQLLGVRTASRRVSRPEPLRAASRRSVLVSAAVLVVLAAGAITAVTALLERPTPAASTSSPPSASPLSFEGLQAERVVFNSSEGVAAEAERVVERALQEERPYETQEEFDAVTRAIDRAPQLRSESPLNRFGFSSGYRGRGEQTFDFLPYGGDEDLVQVVVIDCPGSDRYHWDVRGTDRETGEQRVASASGSCGEGLTAARFIQRHSLEEPRLHVTARPGTEYTIGVIDASFQVQAISDPYVGRRRPVPGGRPVAKGHSVTDGPVRTASACVPPDDEGRPSRRRSALA